MGEPLVRYALEDSVARITLDDPARLNAMSEAMGEALLEALRRAAHESRAVVLIGEGKAFCSGANLDEAMAILEDPARDGGAQLERVFNPSVQAMRKMEQPVITALRGVTAGVGCGIALAADIILCSENAYFFFAFSKVGLVPDGGSTWLLSKAIGRVRAMRLMLLAEKLSAGQALEWGLVTQVVPDEDLDATAMTIAGRLAAGAKSLAMTKRLVWDALECDLDSALHAERVGQCAATFTDDFSEGVRAFMERREVQFKGC